MIKIGIVGFSRNQFDKKAAYVKLEKILNDLTKDKDKAIFEIVSGYTASGVPLIAYKIADKLGLKTVGFSANQAKNVRSGVYSVQKVILVGEKFGDESQSFIDYIDVLVRIGGGKQSRHEVALFKIKNENADLASKLFEEEVEWFGQ